jgi:TPR repeat protein
MGDRQMLSSGRINRSTIMRKIFFIALLVIGLSAISDDVFSEESNIDEIKKLADQGYADAQYNLGVLYYKGEGVPENDAEAMRWFRKAAEQGLAEGQFGLGFMYYNGQGVPINYIEAMKWFRKAAEQGDAEAQYHLGSMYYEAKGGPQNYIEAYVWMSISSAKGNDIANKNLSIVASKMTPSQIEQAQKKAAVLWEKIGK